MRISLDIPDRDLRALGRLARRRGLSRAQLIRTAIAEHLARQAPPAGDTFGLWGAAPEDGLAFERRLRAEWRGG